jgi:hypothetical protein
LNLKLVAVVWTAAVIEVEDEGQSFLLVVFGTNILFLIRAIGARAFTRVMDPAYEIIEIIFFPDASEIRGEVSPFRLVAFADGMAAETSACLDKLPAMHGVAGLVLGQLIG